MKTSIVPTVIGATGLISCKTTVKGMNEWEKYKCLGYKFIVIYHPFYVETIPCLFLVYSSTHLLYTMHKKIENLRTL